MYQLQPFSWQIERFPRLPTTFLQRRSTDSWTNPVTARRDLAKAHRQGGQQIALALQVAECRELAVALRQSGQLISMEPPCSGLPAWTLTLSVMTYAVKL